MFSTKEEQEIISLIKDQIKASQGLDESKTIRRARQRLFREHRRRQERGLIRSKLFSARVVPQKVVDKARKLFPPGTTDRKIRQKIGPEIDDILRESAPMFTWNQPSWTQVAMRHLQELEFARPVPEPEELPVPVVPVPAVPIVPVQGTGKPIAKKKRKKSLWQLHISKVAKQNKGLSAIQIAKLASKSFQKGAGKRKRKRKVKKKVKKSKKKRGKAFIGGSDTVMLPDDDGEMVELIREINA